MLESHLSDQSCLEWVLLLLLHSATPATTPPETNGKQVKACPGGVDKESVGLIEIH